MPKLPWAAIGVSVGLLSIGTTLLVNAYVWSGIGLWVLAASIGAAYTQHERRWRRSTHEMSAWLVEAATYGTVHIQNAIEQDITNPSDVPRLIERHDRWVAVIRWHAETYLHPSDANHISMLHTFTNRGLVGFTNEHARVVNWTAERVTRLRDIARRLQDGQTTLKQIRP